MFAKAEVFDNIPLFDWRELEADLQPIFNTYYQNNSLESPICSERIDDDNS